MTTDPARVIGIEAGTLRPGSAADVAVLDLGGETHVTPEAIRSKSKNTPFLGQTLRGAVVHTLVGGRHVFAHGEVLADLGVVAG